MRAKSLRQSQTSAESLLWSKLRNRQVMDFKFRRQHPVGPYFADFACIELGLIVELDGGQHAQGDAPGYDERRSEVLRQAGFQVLRFWNHEAMNEADAVMDRIAQVASTLTPTLSRKREREQDSSATAQAGATRIPRSQP